MWRLSPSHSWRPNKPLNKPFVWRISLFHAKPQGNYWKDNWRKKMPKFRCPIASITLMIFEVGFKRPRLILTYFHRLLRVCLIFADSWWFCTTPPPPPLSLLLWLFFVLHTVRPLRSSGEKKALSSLTYLTLSFLSFDVFIVFSVL